MRAEEKESGAAESGSLLLLSKEVDFSNPTIKRQLVIQFVS